MRPAVPRVYDKREAVAAFVGGRPKADIILWNLILLRHYVLKLNPAVRSNKLHHASRVFIGVKHKECVITERKKTTSPRR